MKFKHLLLGAMASAALVSHAVAERGSDGSVSIINWQAPSILNPYLSGSNKDEGAASLIVEPLARFDETGTIQPWLAEEIPTVANGGVSEDLTSITWKIKPGLLWSDGSPLTANDAKFSAEYCMHPEGGCAVSNRFESVSSIEVIDDLTIKITFEAPNPVPYGPFVGGGSPILQAAQFAECLGSKTHECTEENFYPIGTGPFVVKDFRPNDSIQMEANPHYRDPDKPAFAKLNFKGGGDAVASARAVMQTGEFDYALTLQLSPDVLAGIQKGGKGVPVTGFGPTVELLYVNNTNPDPSLGPDERAIIRPNPKLSDVTVRRALSMAIDRDILVEIGYGTAGKVTCNLVPAPELYNSPRSDCLQQDIAGANKLLDDAGWVRGGDGVRAKDGVRLSLSFQTSTSAVRQDFQALLKEWWKEIGVETELRNISASVFFSSDPDSPDTYLKFYADLEMFANSFHGTDPQAYLGGYLCDKAPRPSNQWKSANVSRYCDDAFEALHAKLARTFELEERGRIGRELNDMVIDAGTVIPLVHRGRLSARSNSLGGVIMNVWDSELWNAADWYRKADSQ